MPALCGFAIPAESKSIGYGRIFTCVDAVETRHASVVVYRMFLKVYALRFAVSRTQRARVAFGRVYNGFEQRILGQKSENRSDRANAVAICPSVPPRKNADNRQRQQRNRKHPDSPKMHFSRMERIAVEQFRKRRKGVVAPSPYRGNYIGGYSSVRAVRLYDGAYRNKSACKNQCEQNQKCNAQNSRSACIRKPVWPAPSGNV